MHWTISNAEIVTYSSDDVYLEETEEFPARSRNVP